METPLSDTQQNMFSEQHHVSLVERVSLQVETHTIRESANKYPAVATVELLRNTFLTYLIRAFRNRQSILFCLCVFGMV